MPLSDDDLTATWAEYRATRSPQALDLLVRQYGPLAAFFARRALAKAPAHQDREDILAFAHDGLVKAIQNFDPEAGAKFETYATRRIPGAIIDGQRKQDPLPRAMRRKVKVVQSAIESLWDRLQRDPDIHEIANEAEMSEPEIREGLLAQKTLNASLDAEDAEPVAGMAGEAEVTVQLADARAVMAARLAALDARERSFVLAYYCDGLSMKDAAESMGISPDWCRQTRHSTLGFLSP